MQACVCRNLCRAVKGDGGGWIWVGRGCTEAVSLWMKICYILYHYFFLLNIGSGLTCKKDVKMCQALTHFSSWSIVKQLKAHSFLPGTVRDAPERRRPRRPNRTQSYLGRIVEGTLDCSLCTAVVAHGRGRSATEIRGSLTLCEIKVL